MAGTTFIAGTVITHDWLNDVNNFVYNNTPVSPSIAVSAASLISTVPAGGITSIDVQSALNQLDTLKASKASPVFTGPVTAASFTGAGTSLTGTAASLTAGTATTVSTTVASGAVGTTQAPMDNSTKIATTAYVDAAISSPLPTGTIIDFAGTSAPAGFLACPIVQTDISRTTYAALFAAIGTTWGPGDNATTFGMPWFAANYAAVAANGNVASATTGAVKAHTHVETLATSGSGNGPASSAQGNGTASATLSTQSTGGAANFAAGVAVLKCVKL